MEDGFLYAAESGDIDKVRQLLDSGIDPNIQDEAKDTALMYASQLGYIEIVELLLDRGADPNIQNEDKNTALLYAFETGYGYIEIVKLLLDRGADPNISNSAGDTSLILASLQGNIDVSRLLLDKGADPNIQEQVMKNTALMYSSMYGYIDIVRLLLDRGADPNIQNGSGNTALMWISNKGPKEIAELLLEYGADPTIVNNEGLSYNDYHKIKKLQKRFREKRTLKRNRAATRIQSGLRGKQTRKKDYLSRYSRYKQWETDRAFNTILYDEEDIFNYLRENDRNFILHIPDSNNYEAWNVDDIIRLNIIERHDDINVFYECREANHSLTRENIIRDEEYIKLGASNYVVEVPEWIYDDLWGHRIIPEPRIFKLREYKIVNGLVSKNILNYGGSFVSGDHCNQLQPIQTYQLELVSEEELIKAQQRLNLSRVLQQSNLPIGLHDLISQRHRTMQHDREVLDRQRQVDRENELMADYLTELDRAARSSSTDELDRRYRGLLAGISQEDLDEDYLRTRLLLGPRDREQFLRERETARQRSQPQNVARRLFQ